MCKDSPTPRANGGEPLRSSATSGSPGDALAAEITKGPPTSTWSIGRAVPLSSSVPPAGPLSIVSSLSGSPIPSYPPTEVKRWLTCPVFRDYSKRWVPRASQWTPHAPVGTGIHAAIAVLMRHIQTESSVSPKDRPALNARAEAAGLQALGEQYEAQETWAIEGLQKLVVKGYRILRDAIETELLPGATILGVEMVDPDSPVPAGVKVPRMVDAILERDGALEIWDWKTAMRLDDQYLGEKMRSVLHQWQLLDYSWHVQTWFPGRHVLRAGHGLVVLAPSAKVRFLPVQVEPGRLDTWRKEADTIWRTMHAHDSGASIWHNWEACSDRHLHFGRECLYFPACHELLGDESLFSGIYSERRDDGLQDPENH